MSASTRGPLEEKLLELFNKTEEVTTEDIHSLVDVLLDATREDMYYNLTFQGKILPGNSQ